MKALLTTLWRVMFILILSTAVCMGYNLSEIGINNSLAPALKNTEVTLSALEQAKATINCKYYKGNLLVRVIGENFNPKNIDTIAEIYTRDFIAIKLDFMSKDDFILATKEISIDDFSQDITSKTTYIAQTKLYAKPSVLKDIAYIRMSWKPFLYSSQLYK